MIIVSSPTLSSKYTQISSRTESKLYSFGLCGQAINHIYFDQRSECADLSIRCSNGFDMFSSVVLIFIKRFVNPKIVP